jgi:hypothetical protein
MALGGPGRTINFVVSCLDRFPISKLSNFFQNKSNECLFAF